MINTTGYQGKNLGLYEEPPKPEAEKPKIYLFEERDATIHMMLNGYKIKECGCYNEIYGPGTHIKTAIESALELMKAYALKHDSIVTLEIIEKTYKVRKRKTGRKWLYSPEQEEFEHVGYSFEEVEKVVWKSSDLKTEPPAAKESGPNE